MEIDFKEEKDGEKYSFAPTWGYLDRNGGGDIDLADPIEKSWIEEVVEQEFVEGFLDSR